MDGTVVRFNEQDGSMKSLSTFRIDVQVPIELDLSKPAEVYVSRQGRVTNKLSVPVTPAAPGVVTRNAIGTGQAVAINADGSDNSSTRRAAPGSAIRITATGLGRTQPPVAAGQYPGVTPPPPTVLPVYANIGGQPAQVVSATAAAGKVALYEVQVVVPSGLPSGAWEVILSAGYYSSQPGAVIFVQ
jgi:uncharacterized protein (TIGR03437 family)